MSTFTIWFKQESDNGISLIHIPPDKDQVTETFIPPYTQKELESVLRALELLNRGVKTYLDPDDRTILHNLSDEWDPRPYWLPSEASDPLPDLPVRVGRSLYQALFPGRIGEAFRQMRYQVSTEPGGVPLNLRLQFEPADPITCRYPWELLRESLEAPPLMLQTPITRYLLTGDPIPNLSFNTPLSVTVVVARPEDMEPLKNTDRQQIEEALQGPGVHQDSVKIVPAQATFESLLKVVVDHQPQIIHFDGHGAFGRFCPQCKGQKPSRRTFVEWWIPRCPETDCQYDLQAEKSEGYLIFEKDDGQADYVQARYISDRLAFHKPKLFILSACQTATVTEGAIFNSVAPALVRAGIPAAVAMQFSVEAVQMGKFCGQLYQSLLKTGRLEEAVTDARLLLNDNEIFRPVLFLRSRVKSGPLMPLFDSEPSPADAANIDIPLLERVSKSLPSMPDAAIIAEIKELVQKDQLVEAATKLSSLEGYQGEASLQLRRLNRIQRQERIGTITRQEADVERSKIAEAILQITSS